MRKRPLNLSLSLLRKLPIEEDILLKFNFLACLGSESAFLMNSFLLASSSYPTLYSFEHMVRFPECPVVIFLFVMSIPASTNILRIYVSSLLTPMFCLVRTSVNIKRGGFQGFPRGKNSKFLRGCAPEPPWGANSAPQTPSCSRRHYVPSLSAASRPRKTGKK